MDPFGTIPLFEVPEPYRRPTPPETTAIRWHSYKGKRTGCDDCVRDIVGGGYRYLAEPATHVRIEGDEKLYLCGTHASRRKVVEDLA